MAASVEYKPDLFESSLPLGSEMQNHWQNVKPYFYQGQVASREEAYLLFSRVLKITQEALESATVKELWLNLLNQGCFELKIEGMVKKSYNFSTIADLVNRGKTSFDLEFTEVDPAANNMVEVAEAVHSVALSSIEGTPPGVEFFQRKLTSPKVFCLLAKENENVIAAMYGTYLELEKVNFFHINILGRKIEYPSVNIIEKLREECLRIHNRFPNIHYWTLCVKENNPRMFTRYQELDFEQVDCDVNPVSGEKTYFLAKKIDKTIDVSPPKYQDYQEANRKLQS
jgi:hypothetical protein